MSRIAIAALLLCLTGCGPQRTMELLITEVVKPIAEDVRKDTTWKAIQTNGAVQATNPELVMRFDGELVQAVRGIVTITLNNVSGQVSLSGNASPEPAK